MLSAAQELTAAAQQVQRLVLAARLTGLHGPVGPVLHQLRGTVHALEEGRHTLQHLGFAKPHTFLSTACFDCNQGPSHSGPHSDQISEDLIR